MRNWLLLIVVSSFIGTALAAEPKVKKLGPQPEWLSRVDPRARPLDQAQISLLFTNALSALQDKIKDPHTAEAKTDISNVIASVQALASDPAATSKVGKSTMEKIQSSVDSIKNATTPEDVKKAATSAGKAVKEASERPSVEFPEVDEVFDITAKEQTVKFGVILKTATNGVIGLRDVDEGYVTNRASATSNFFTVEIYNVSKETNRTDGNRLKVEGIDWAPPSIGQQKTFKGTAVLRQSIPSGTKIGLRVVPTSTLEKSKKVQQRVDLLEDYLEAIQKHLTSNPSALIEVSNVLSSAAAAFPGTAAEAAQAETMADTDLDQKFEDFEKNWGDFAAKAKDADKTNVVRAMIKRLVDLRQIKKLPEFNASESVVTAGKVQYVFTDIVQKVAQVPPKDVEVTLGKGIADHFIVLSLQLQNVHTNKLLIYGDGVQVKCETLAMSYDDARSHRQLLEANLTRIQMPDGINNSAGTNETAEIEGLTTLLADTRNKLDQLNAKKSDSNADKVLLRFQIQDAEDRFKYLQAKKSQLRQRQMSSVHRGTLGTNEWLFRNWRPVPNASGHFELGSTNLMVHSIPLSFMRSGYLRREMNTTKARTFRVAEFAGGIAAALVPLTGGGPDLGTGVGLYGNVLIPAAHKLFGDTSEVQRQAFENESLDQYLELEVGQTCHKLIYLPRNGIDEMMARRVLFISSVPGMPDGKFGLDEISLRQSIIIKAAIVVSPEE